MRQHLVKDLRPQYSWLPKGYGSQIWNITSFKSWSLIAALGSDGNYICIIWNETVNSHIFSQFLKILQYWISKNKELLKCNVTFLLDNAPTHLSNETQTIIRKIGVPTLFLPPYSPTLAPIELFFRYIKSKIRSVRSKTKIVYGAKSGDNTIFKAWWEIGKKYSI